jgi:hypothetical protein
MWPYWLMLMVPAALAVVGRDSPQIGASNARFRVWGGVWILAALVIAIFAGYRFEVGGDWFNYAWRVDWVSRTDLGILLTMPDPGYSLLNWISGQRGWGIIGVNVIGAAIFAIGLVAFCRSMPRPWLALAVSIPYLVIVVGMGYTRQGIALSLGMLGLLALLRQSTVWFVAWVLLGATFHMSAVLLLPIAALTRTRNRYWTALWVGMVAVGAYFVFVAESVDRLYMGYIETEYHSEGALIRVFMNALPAALLLAWCRYFRFSSAEASLWQWFAIVSLVLLGLYFVLPSSTAVDRIGLYMLPLQLVVFSHLPNVLCGKNGGNAIWVGLVLGYYFAVQFVWLNFATHAQYWLPYRFYPFETIS